MRCAEARRRITARRGAVDDDRELARHLNKCAACAAFARAERALNHDLAMADYGPDIDDMPLSVIRSRVETRERKLTRKNAKEIPIMSAALKQLKRRPALGLSMMIACAVLVVGTLVPFSFESTVGYEVAIAGVDRELAVDTEKVNRLLTALGVENADITVGDCEKTCVLKISELKTEGEVKLVTTAFDELGDFECETFVLKSDGESETLLDKAQNMIVVRQFDTPPDDSVYKIVIETISCLDSASDGQFNIWVSDDSCAQVIGAHTFISNDRCDTAGAYMMMTARDGAHMMYMMPDEDGNMELVDMDDPGAMERLKELGIEIDGDAITAQGSRMFVVSPGCGSESTETSDIYENALIINKDDDGSTLVFVDENGVRHEIDLDDPDAEDQLAALGLDVEFFRSDDSTVSCMIKGEGDNCCIIELNKPIGDSEEGDAFLKETGGELPNGFELNQNHPNPFNPTTEISFSIPEPQHVRLVIFNVRGQLVRTLLDADLAAGEHTVQWNSQDEAGSQVSSGVYFYRLTAGDVTATKKMTLLK